MTVGYGHNFTAFDKFIPYKIEALETVKNQKGTWNSTKLRVYDDRDNRTIKEFVRNYPSFGTTAFYPFKYENEWFAFIGPSYVGAEIISLKDGSKVASFKESDDYISWCPTNFYVPAMYRNMDVPTFTSNEGEDYFVGVMDSSFGVGNDRIVEIEADKDFRHLRYAKTAFQCGVFWGADTEWLVFRIDLEQAMKTGIISEPEKKTYCFKFDYYKTNPEIRQFMQFMADDGIDDARVFYYTQKWTDLDNWTNEDEK